jgi:phosphoglycolate phosphatase
VVQGLKSVLFDLDGTLADTAPDLGYALNRLRVDAGLGELSMEEIRPQASNGVRGLLSLGFGITPEDASFSGLREQFLDIYMDNLCVGTRLFDGMEELIDEIERTGLSWGIVTNKPMKFTVPLVEKLGLNAQVVVGGDTCSRQKPHPDPLLYAADRLSVSPAQCLYLGDDRRDVEASLSAGMYPIVAKFGYLSGGMPETWGAKAYIDHPMELVGFL